MTRSGPGSGAPSTGRARAGPLTSAGGVRAAPRPRRRPLLRPGGSSRRPRPASRRAVQQRPWVDFGSMRSSFESPQLGHVRSARAGKSTDTRIHRNPRPSTTPSATPNRWSAPRKTNTIAAAIEASRSGPDQPGGALDVDLFGARRRRQRAAWAQVAQATAQVRAGPVRLGVALEGDHPLIIGWSPGARKAGGRGGGRGGRGGSLHGAAGTRGPGAGGDARRTHLRWGIGRGLSPRRSRDPASPPTTPPGPPRKPSTGNRPKGRPPTSPASRATPSEPGPRPRPLPGRPGPGPRPARRAGRVPAPRSLDPRGPGRRGARGGRGPRTPVLRAQHHQVAAGPAAARDRGPPRPANSRPTSSRWWSPRTAASRATPSASPACWRDLASTSGRSPADPNPR